ncbi:hypothetical protein BK010_09240 [Tenericutes bacterium MO-XQ]|nr:hypothetical protein BK010_09240 [Tenericutes bacterium MO-XQ]
MNLKLNEIKFNIAQINLCTELEGPFKRMAIWFQGCNLNCKGCCNPELQDFEKKHILSIDQIIKIAKDSMDKYGIEGVTFLGGEPTLQKNINILATELRKLDLGIILFTGFRVSQINKDIVASVDLIVDGRFEIDKIDTKRNLIGSTNQKLNVITKRYQKSLKWFNERRDKVVDVNIKDGFYITGDPVLYNNQNE